MARPSAAALPAIGETARCLPPGGATVVLAASRVGSGISGSSARRRRAGAGVEVVAADDDGRLPLSAAHQLVEEQAGFVALAVAEPADARRQSLKFDALLGHADPAM